MGERSSAFRSVFRSLAANVFALLVLSSLVAILSLVGMISVNNRFQETIDQVVRAEELADDVRTNLLQARRREKDFLLRWRFEDDAGAQYIAQNRDAVASIESAVDELSEIEDERVSAVALPAIATMRPLIVAYLTEFTRLTDLIAARGFQDSGAEGDLRAVAHDIEALLAENPELSDSTETLLQIRRREKDYMLRNNESCVDVDLDVSAVCGEVAEVKGYIARLTLEATSVEAAEDVKAGLLTLIAGYEGAFDRLVEVDSSIIMVTEDFRFAAQSIEDQAEAILSQVQAVTDADIAEAADATALATRWVGFSVALIILLGAGLAYALVYQTRLHPSVDSETEARSYDNP